MQIQNERMKVKLKKKLENKVQLITINFVFQMMTKNNRNKKKNYLKD